MLRLGNAHPWNGMGQPWRPPTAGGWGGVVPEEAEPPCPSPRLQTDGPASFISLCPGPAVRPGPAQDVASIIQPPAGSHLSCLWVSPAGYPSLSFSVWGCSSSWTRHPFPAGPEVLVGRGIRFLFLPQGHVQGA